MYQKVLKNIGNFNEEHLTLFSKRIRFREVKKDEILLPGGDICKSFFFNISGAFYQFNLKNEIEQNILDLHLENEWFLNNHSFITQLPSESTIVAYTEGKVLELTIEAIHGLITESPAFFQLGKILDQANDRIHFFDNRSTPSEKYKHILETKPALIQNFPLKIIASYLKITPETLSRVRESLAKGKIVS